MIGVMYRHKGVWGYKDDDEDFITLSPEEAGAKMVDFLKNCTDPQEYETKKGKTKTADKNTLFVTDLDLIGAALHKEIVKSGFKDLTGKISAREKIPVLGYNYLIGGDMGKWYGFTVVNQNEAKNSIYALENVIPHLSISDILSKRLPDEDDDLHAICRTCYSIVRLLTDITGKESMTISSYAMRRWTTFTNIFDQGKTYPDMYKVDCDLYSCDMDAYLRKAYKGGWCYVNADTTKTYHDGITLDVNSLYPYVMKYRRYPIGFPKMFIGDIPDKYVNLLNRGLMIAFIHISCRFTVKPGFLPFVQIPGDFFRQGVLSDSRVYNNAGVIDKPVELTFTHFEYELFKKHYDIKDLQIYDGCVFYTSDKVFTDYVDEYYSMKAAARKDGDIITSSVAKHMLNNLSGNLAKKRERENMVLDDNGQPCTVVNCESNARSLIQIAACITSYARCLMVETAQANYERFLYCDTDSLHLLGYDIPKDIKISPTELGHFKIERKWKCAHFYKSKVYIEEDDKEGFKVTYAGCPSEVQSEIENRLNGQRRLAKYFGQTREEMQLSIDCIKIDGIPYECETSNGTFTPDVRVIPWNIEIPSDKWKEATELRKIRNRNLDNLLRSRKRATA